MFLFAEKNILKPEKTASKTFLFSALLHPWFTTDARQMFPKESEQVHACMDIGSILQANVKPQGFVCS